MKIKELLNAITIPITNEESDLLEKFDESESITKGSLEPREQIIANSLVTKDILRRKTIDGKLTYSKKIR